MSDRRWPALLKETLSEGSADQITRLGAALAYYGVLSLPPLGLIAAALVGKVFGQHAAQGAVFNELLRFMGAPQAHAIESLIVSAGRRASGARAELAGAVTLLFAASSAVTEVQEALNRIFDAQAGTLGWLATIKQRLISLAFVLGVGSLLIASMLLSTAIAAAGETIGAITGVPELALHAANDAATFVVVSLLFAMMFRYLPLARVAWREAWMGAAVTATMFLIGDLALSLYLAKTGPLSVYGAAGSLLAVLIWSYYSAQIFYLGAEFTQVYARRRASRASP